MRRARDPEALRDAIERRKLSQRALARAALCSRMTPSRLLAGKPVGDEAAMRLARALAVNLDEFFEVVESSESQRSSNRKAAA